VDKKGNKASKEVVNKVAKGLAVEVAGPSKVKVHCSFLSLLRSLCLFHANLILSVISHFVGHH